MYAISKYQSFEVSTYQITFVRVQICFFNPSLPAVGRKVGFPARTSKSCSKSCHNSWQS